MKYIFLILILGNFFNLYSQNDTVKNYFFSANFNLQYKFIIGDPYSPSFYMHPSHPGYPSWYPDQTNYSTFSFNSNINFNCRIYKKIFFKTGLQYFNRRTKVTSNYDTITKYSEPQYRNTWPLKAVYNSNSIEIPVVINYTSKRIIIGAGLGIELFDFNYNHFELYDQSKKTSIKNIFIWNDYNKSGEFPMAFVCSFDYLLNKKKYPLYLTSNIKKYIGVNEIYVSLGLNVFLTKMSNN